MSEGSVYQRKDGRWVAKRKDARGKWRYSYRRTKAEARKALREALRDRDEGIVPAGKMTVAALLDGWLADYQDAVSRRTWLNRESIVRVHIKPHIGTKRLAKLSPDDIRGLYRSKLRSGLKPSTVKRTLRHEDIDFEKGTLNVRRTLWRNRVYPPKTQRSRRTIKLPQIALDALRRHAAERNSTEGWLFPTSGGNPVDASAFFHWGWKPMLRKAGLPETTRYHDLRHTAASIMLGQNVPLPVVSYVLGHASSNITATIYAHMLENMSGRGTDGMDDALR